MSLSSPETLADIKRRVNLGQKTPQIARELNTTVNALKVICSRHKVSLRQYSPNTDLYLSQKVWDYFRRRSGQKDMEPETLMEYILTTVADDDLLKAILDD